MSKLSIEQSFNNVVIACEKVLGSKADHAALEASLVNIKEVLFPADKGEEEVVVEE